MSDDEFLYNHQSTGLISNLNPQSAWSGPVRTSFLLNSEVNINSVDPAMEERSRLCFLVLYHLKGCSGWLLGIAWYGSLEEIGHIRRKHSLFSKHRNASSHILLPYISKRPPICIQTAATATWIFPDAEELLSMGLRLAFSLCFS